MTNHNDTESGVVSQPSSKLVVSFRGQAIDLTLQPGLRVRDVKSRVLAEASGHTTTDTSSLSPSDLKLLFQGKVLSQDDDDISQLLKKSKKVYRLLATGVSSEEAQAMNEEIQQGLQQMAPRIRDDISQQGQRKLAERQRLGQVMLQKANKNNLQRSSTSSSKNYGFGKIETLPMLPDQHKAREILTQLAHDPGILACMAKYEWNVGSLAELFPDGQVGQSEVCVMGLNRNKGQQILLRVRTDDLKGFRKLLSIKKVLYHELAHNVHSEHNQDFFQLMRQIERECNELDWTRGAGVTDASVGTTTLYTGGAFRLGGASNESSQHVPVRELAARAAMMRLTAEEEEIQQHCGCGKIETSTTEDEQQEDQSSTEHP